MQNIPRSASFEQFFSFEMVENLMSWMKSSGGLDVTPTWGLKTPALFDTLANGSSNIQMADSSWITPGFCCQVMWELERSVWLMHLLCSWKRCVLLFNSPPQPPKSNVESDWPMKPLVESFQLLYLYKPFCNPHVCYKDLHFCAYYDQALLYL